MFCVYLLESTKCHLMPFTDSSVYTTLMLELNNCQSSNANLTTAVNKQTEEKNKLQREVIQVTVGERFHRYIEYYFFRGAPVK